MRARARNGIILVALIVGVSCVARNRPSKGPSTPPLTPSHAVASVRSEGPHRVAPTPSSQTRDAPTPLLRPAKIQPSPLPPGRLALVPVWHLSASKQNWTTEQPWVIGSVGDWTVVRLGERVLTLDSSSGRVLGERSLSGASLTVVDELLLVAREAAAGARLDGFELPTFTDRFSLDVQKPELFVAEGRVLSGTRAGNVRVFAAVNTLPLGAGTYGGSEARELIAVNDDGSLAWRRISEIGDVGGLGGDAKHLYVASDSALVAHDARTGDVVWSAKGTRQREPGFDHLGMAVQAGAVFFAAGGHAVQRLDPATGAKLWETELKSQGVPSLIVHEAALYALVDRELDQPIQLVALSIASGRVLFRKDVGGRALSAVGQEGLVLIGKVGAREGVILLDPRSGAPRASFRVGDGPTSVVRSVGSDASTWFVAATASAEIVGLRLTGHAPKATAVTVRGRVTFGAGQALAKFALMRDPDRPGGGFEQTSTDANGEYRFSIKAHDVIGVAPSPVSLSALRNSLSKGNPRFRCIAIPEAHYVRAGAVGQGDRFDFQIACSDFIGR